MFLLETLLHALAHLHDRSHVDFVEGGQDGVGRLRLQQTLGHAGAQTGHGHALLGAITQVGSDHGHLRQNLGGRAGGDGRRCGHGGLGCRSTRRHSGQHIALGHSTVFATARHRAGGQIVVGQQLGGSGHGHAGLGLRCCRCGSGDRRCGGHSCWCRRGSGGRSAGHGSGVDARDELIGRHGGTVALQDFHQHASGGRGTLQHHLVGFDLDQDLIDRDGFAGFFLPLQQGGLGHRLGELRNFDFYDCHVSSTLIFCVGRGRRGARAPQGPPRGAPASYPGYLLRM